MKLDIHPNLLTTEIAVLDNIAHELEILNVNIESINLTLQTLTNVIIHHLTPDFKEAK